MKSTILVLLTLLFALSFTFAQGQNNLSGTITSDQGDKIFFATVALHNVKDSLLAKAESTDNNGRYQIKNIAEGTYFMTVSYLGYETVTIEDLAFPSAKNVIDVALQEATEILDGVVIKARVPLLEQKSDRLVVNVANSVTSLNGSLLDVMKKVPGMIVTGDQLRMAGQSNITILINGKSTRYIDVQSLLRDMPGDNIEKVEVIHQPGAEFEASGTGPVINIILKKNSLYGTNGSANIGVGKGENWSYKSGLSLSHYQGSVNINAGIGYRNSPYWEQLTIRREINGDVYDQVSTDPNFSKTFRSNLGLDWDVTDKHRVGFTSSLSSNTRDYDFNSITDIDFAEDITPDLSLKTTNEEDKNWNLLVLNPYYVFEIDTNGQKIEMDYNIARYRSMGSTMQSNTVTNSDTKFPGQQFLSDGITVIHAAKADYTYPFSNHAKLTVGAKYSFADLDNNFRAFEEDEGGQFVLNNLQSNEFLFSERIMAGYGKLTWQKAKWNGTFGLRYEDSFSEGRSVQVDTVLTRPIKQLFPSVSIAREIKGPLGASLAYSYRIDRPNYSSLNPFRFYLDPFTFSAGNPMLRPALTHSAKFNLTYEKQPFFNVEYKQSKDAILQIIDQNDDQGTTNQTDINFSDLMAFNTSLFFPLDFIPKISGYAGVITSYTDYSTELRNEIFRRSRWSLTSFISTNFTLPWDINAEVSGWYNSGELDGIITGSWLYGIDMGFSKKILNNKGRISLGVDNLFYRPFYGTIEYSTIDLQVKSEWDAPVINAQFSYKFGNQHMKRKENAGGSGKDMINRAQ